jgi:hypothetical protein
MRVMLGLASLVGGIFKTGETRKIGLAYILRNGEFSCDRTVKFRPDLIRDHSSIPKKFGVPISKGLGAVHCQRPAIFFCADCSIGIWIKNWHWIKFLFILFEKISLIIKN